MIVVCYDAWYTKESISAQHVTCFLAKLLTPKFPLEDEVHSRNFAKYFLKCGKYGIIASTVCIDIE